jgi:hypothetical protein
MRCIACDRQLSDFESTRKSATTGEYVDLCNTCFQSIQRELNADEREDLRGDVDEFDEVEEGE